MVSFFVIVEKRKQKSTDQVFVIIVFGHYHKHLPQFLSLNYVLLTLDIEERDLEWEKEFQLKPHYVYLANSSGLKVGITRITQGITRWMDQGASQAILFAKVPNRRYSGDIEVALKKHVSDVTNWRKCSLELLQILIC